MSPFWSDGAVIQVHLADGKPYEIEWQGQWHSVTCINRHWSVHTLWWKKELWCRYWELAMYDTMGVVYEDVLSEEWYLERIYA